MKKAQKCSHSKLNRIPLWTQLLLLITLATTLLISLILLRDYQQNRKSVMEQQITTSHRLLDLEMQNIEQYIKDLASFCLQPLYDSSFNLTIKTRSPLTSVQQSYIKEQIRMYYYSRTDLNGYEIHFIHQNISFGRGENSQHISLMQDSTVSSEEGFLISASGKNYNAIEPSSLTGNFFSYYQSIIHIQTGEPEAVVKLEVDDSYAQALNQEHQNSGEFICIFNQNGDLLFSGDTELIAASCDDILTQISDTFDEDSFTLYLEEKPYLGVICHNDRYGLRLATFLPMAAIHERIASILHANVMIGLLLWATTSALIFLILRLATRPLMRLNNHMRQVGDGNFSPVADVGGSREISDLSLNFNDMMRHIDHLIRQNYLSEINEKTSRLAALEAQLNPHFLYNTLQAIGTEALINDQPQINQMITSLASNLRYSIKGGDLVNLNSEITYVRNYVLLQKMRLEDRLTVLFDIDEQLLDMQIPKISIQILVENSIIHGLGPDNDSIIIQIHTDLAEDMLKVIVTDNGCGITPEQLQKMQKDFLHFLQPGTAGKIGLANLYSRLQILYQERAKLDIQSTIGKGTCITMQIPVNPPVPVERSSHV